ncbi:hypothetical protein [Qipengyuania flava]|jgi:hypothetical protein|uniref:hypothetical protein n=1 Tax=Qipengyuania flava TaxID=192812 RepID=UPI001C586484|nr:hypothetical protein [Qipengyuania flava]MBW3168041.1 hypothetical protein [Qipengyuania flava]MBY5965279.1 hypothetical protein [Qipengyuania flava]MBY6011603.1 hypothetical protein [Qipengyuania flava]MBY6026045.1 hypothetical protein [Qipengyuania flava]|tara:strand:+ start:110 stop:388 length:279 start_codon:yes stop_codon:yes gene_type:complete
MKMILTAASVLAFSASPVLAQEAPPEKPKMCEMMHDGKKMQGMMMKDNDGKMSCQMMDHSKMDHSKMEHGQSGHDEKKAAEAEKPQTEHRHD